MYNNIYCVILFGNLKEFKNYFKQHIGIINKTEINIHNIKAIDYIFINCLNHLGTIAISDHENVLYSIRTIIKEKYYIEVQLIDYIPKMGCYNVDGLLLIIDILKNRKIFNKI